MMDDLISRQEATTIPILPKEHRQYQTMNIDDAYDLGWLDCQNCIEKLPSAQPKPDEWCTDCKEYDPEKHCCPRFNRVIRNVLKDAQPEQRKGKWIHERLCSSAGGTYPVTRCSVCENAMPFEWEAEYCPNCGAKMEK